MTDGGAAAFFSDAGGGGDGGAAGGGADPNAGGGAADTGSAGGAAGEGGGGDPNAGGAGDGQGGATAWYEGLSDAGEGDALSDRAWMENKKYSDLATMVKAMRSLESKVGSKLELPKEGDPPEKAEAFYKAIGRPDTAEGYEIRLPEGVDGELDSDMLKPIAEAAWQAGVPKAMFEKIADVFIAQQLDQEVHLVAARDAEAEAKVKEWGDNADANKALMVRAAQQLGLTHKDVADIQKGFGAGRTMDLFQKLGAGLAEDAFINGGDRRQFGITAAQARVELDRMNADPEIMKKVAANDPATVQRRERLIGALAAEEERKARAG